MGRIHILHIRDSSGIFGGERVILTLGKNIDPNLFDFSLLCMRSPERKSDQLVALAEKIGLHVDCLDVAGRFDPRAILELRNLIRSRNISLIHSHDFKSNFYVSLAARNLGIRKVVTAHGSTRETFLKRMYLFMDEYFIYRSFDRIIAVSEKLKMQLAGKLGRSEKIEVIQNGYDPEILDLDRDRSEPPLPVEKHPGSGIFAVVGRLFSDKGHAQFIDAFSRIAGDFPGISALIVGDGPEKENIHRQIRSLNLQNRIICCGVRRNMKDVYEMIDCLVIPSFTEGLPYALLEAMSCGKPVIATSVGDIPLLVEDSVSGYLVTPGDIYALAGKMKNIILLPEHAERMAKKASELVRKEYSVQKMVGKTQEIYLSLL